MDVEEEKTAGLVVLGLQMIHTIAEILINMSQEFFCFVNPVIEMTLIHSVFSSFSSLCVVSWHSSVLLFSGLLIPL